MRVARNRQTSTGSDSGKAQTQAEAAEQEEYADP